jgi:hypothetical protein
MGREGRAGLDSEVFSLTLEAAAVQRNQIFPHLERTAEESGFLYVFIFESAELGAVPRPGGPKTLMSHKQGMSCRNQSPTTWRMNWWELVKDAISELKPRDSFF